MANPINVEIFGTSLNSFGFTANDTIEPIGLNTFGFIWLAAGIWSPSPIEDTVSTIWVDAPIESS